MLNFLNMSLENRSPQAFADFLRDQEYVNHFGSERFTALYPNLHRKDKNVHLQVHKKALYQFFLTLTTKEAQRLTNTLIADWTNWQSNFTREKAPQPQQLKQIDPEEQPFCEQTPISPPRSISTKSQLAVDKSSKRAERKQKKRALALAQRPTYETGSEKSSNHQKPNQYRSRQQQGIQSQANPNANSASVNAQEATKVQNKTLLRVKTQPGDLVQLGKNKQERNLSSQAFNSTIQPSKSKVNLDIGPHLQLAENNKQNQSNPNKDVALEKDSTISKSILSGSRTRRSRQERGGSSTNKVSSILENHAKIIKSSSISKLSAGESGEVNKRDRYRQPALGANLKDFRVDQEKSKITGVENHGQLVTRQEITYENSAQKIVTEIITNDPLFSKQQEDSSLPQSNLTRTSLAQSAQKQGKRCFSAREPTLTSNLAGKGPITPRLDHFANLEEVFSAGQAKVAKKDDDELEAPRPSLFSNDPPTEPSNSVQPNNNNQEMMTPADNKKSEQQNKLTSNEKQKRQVDPQRISLIERYSKEHLLNRQKQSKSREKTAASPVITKKKPVEKGALKKDQELKGSTEEVGTKIDPKQDYYLQMQPKVQSIMSNSQRSSSAAAIDSLQQSQKLTKPILMAESRKNSKTMKSGQDLQQNVSSAKTPKQAPAKKSFAKIKSKPKKVSQQITVAAPKQLPIATLPKDLKAAQLQETEASYNSTMAAAQIPIIHKHLEALKRYSSNNSSQRGQAAGNAGNSGNAGGGTSRCLSPNDSSQKVKRSRSSSIATLNQMRPEWDSRVNLVGTLSSNTPRIPSQLYEPPLGYMIKGKRKRNSFQQQQEASERDANVEIRVQELRKQQKTPDLQNLDTRQPSPKFVKSITKTLRPFVKNTKNALSLKVSAVEQLDSENEPKSQSDAHQSNKEQDQKQENRKVSPLKKFNRQSDAFKLAKQQASQTFKSFQMREKSQNLHQTPRSIDFGESQMTAQVQAADLDAERNVPINSEKDQNKQLNQNQQQIVEEYDQKKPLKGSFTHERNKSAQEVKEYAGGEGGFQSMAVSVTNKMKKQASMGILHQNFPPSQISPRKIPLSSRTPGHNTTTNAQNEDKKPLFQLNYLKGLKKSDLFKDRTSESKKESNDLATPLDYMIEERSKDRIVIKHSPHTVKQLNQQQHHHSLSQQSPQSNYQQKSELSSKSKNFSAGSKHLELQRALKQQAERRLAEKKRQVQEMDFMSRQQNSANKKQKKIDQLQIERIQKEKRDYNFSPRSIMDEKEKRQSMIEQEKQVELKAVHKAMRTKVPSLQIQVPPQNNPEDKSPPSNIFDCPPNELQRPVTTRSALQSNFASRTVTQMHQNHPSETLLKAQRSQQQLQITGNSRQKRSAQNSDMLIVSNSKISRNQQDKTDEDSIQKDMLLLRSGAGSQSSFRKSNSQLEHLSKPVLRRSSGKLLSEESQKKIKKGGSAVRPSQPFSGYNQSQAQFALSLRQSGAGGVTAQSQSGRTSRNNAGGIYKVYN